MKESADDTSMFCYHCFTPGSPGSSLTDMRRSFFEFNEEKINFLTCFEHIKTIKIEDDQNPMICANCIPKLRTEYNKQTIPAVKLEPVLDIIDVFPKNSTLDETCTERSSFGSESDTDTTFPKKAIRSRRTQVEVDQDPVWSCFEKSSLPSKFACKLCGVLIIKNLSNLKRHLRSLHPKVFSKLESTKFLPVNTMVGLKKPSHESPIKINLSKLQLIRSCIGLVFDDLLPFSMLDSDNFRSLLDCISDGIAEKDGEKKMRMSSRVAKEMVKVAAEKVRDRIRVNVKDRIVSVKIDCVARQNRSLLRTSCQYRKNNEHKLHTLGLLNLTDQHILANMSLYGIRPEQVMSLTSDDGANMLMSSELLAHLEIDDDVGEDCNDTYKTKLQEYMEATPNFDVENIQTVRCVAHTVQLCAMDLTKNPDIQKKILQSRNITKHLSKASNDIIPQLGTHQFPMPVIDSAAQWLSTYNMHENLKKCKAVIDEQVICDSDYWEFVDAYTMLLLPVKEAIEKFQTDHLNYADFYVIWVTLCLVVRNSYETNKSTNKYIELIGEALMNSLAERQKNILDNDIAIACLFLDPRFHNTLTDQQKQTAKAFMKKVWLKLDKLQPLCQERSTTSDAVPAAAPSYTSSNITKPGIGGSLFTAGTSLFGTFLNQSCLLKTTTTQTPPSINKIIDGFSLQPVHVDINIFDYWHKIKFDEDCLEIYRIFKVLYAVPATQASVSSAFAALKLLLTSLGTNLSPELMEDIIMLKLNADLVDKGVLEHVVQFYNNCDSV